jgi:hypothetical protein
VTDATGAARLRRGHRSGSIALSIRKPCVFADLGERRTDQQDVNDPNSKSLEIAYITVHIYITVFLYSYGGAMEHLVRVQNERDRRTLAWLRALVGDPAIAEAARSLAAPSKPYLSTVCRLLGVTAPPFSTLHRPAPSATAEQSLATIRQILASRNGQRPPVSTALLKTLPRAGAATTM